jgi:DNA replication protein DnaC
LPAGIRKAEVLHPAQLDFLHARENVVLLGPPGTGKTHPAIAIAIRTCLAGQRVAFATATEWVERLSEAQRAGRLAEETARLGRLALLVMDEVGYIPVDPAAANLIFQLMSARYERASLIVTSDKPFSAWGEIFGDEVVAAAMIDRLVHDAEIIAPQRRQLPPARQGRGARYPPLHEGPAKRGLSSSGRRRPGERRAGPPEAAEVRSPVAFAAP